MEDTHRPLPASHPLLEPCWRSAKAAARWWADQLRSKPKPFDNGDLMSSAIANVALSTMPVSAPPSEDQLTVFVDALALAVMQQFFERPTGPWSLHHVVHLNCDYSPEKTIMDALEVADLHNHPRVVRLPAKVSMHVHVFDVEVRNGYRAPYKFIHDERGLRLKLAHAHLEYAQALDVVVDYEVIPRDSAYGTLDDFRAELAKKETALREVEKLIQLGDVVNRLTHPASS